MIGTGIVARPRLHVSELRALGPEAAFATGNRVIAATINSLDQLVLAAVTGTVVAAYYNLGKRLETTFVTVANSFTTVLFQPLFARSTGSDLARVVRMGLLTILITCGLPAAIVATNGTAIVTLLFGAQWQAAAAVASLLALSGLARGVGMVPGALLSISGRNRELLATSIVSAMGSLAIVAVLGPVSLSACAAALAAKNGAISLWLGVLTRREAGSAIQRYVIDILLPFLVLLGAIAVLQSIAEGSSDGTPPQLVPILISGLTASFLGGLFVIYRRSTDTAAGPIDAASAGS
jgi:O-antigen/teichoic acid export membrane protein